MRLERTKCRDDGACKQRQFLGRWAIFPGPDRQVRLFSFFKSRRHFTGLMSYLEIRSHIFALVSGDFYVKIVWFREEYARELYEIFYFIEFYIRYFIENIA